MTQTGATMQVFSGSAITAEELLVLAEFAAPSHFVSSDHLREAADNLAEWTDHHPATIRRALRLASHQDVRSTVIDLLAAASQASSGPTLARAS